MAGRHGPPSQTTFYLSLATAALRGLLVVAALALGFLVLSKAFLPGDGAPPTTPVDEQTTLTTAPTSPATTAPPIRNQPSPLDPSEIKLQVLNGTEVSGLAGDTADLLEDAGYDILAIADAETSYEITTLFHKPKRKADAELLKSQFFAGAELQVSDKDVKADITVNIGADYAASQDEGAASGTEDEST